MSTAVETPPAHHPPPTKKRKPSSRACQPCRELHKSCSSERPCQRCVKHGRAHLCVTPAPKPKRSTKMMQLTTGPSNIAPAIPTFNSPVLAHEAPRPMPTGNEFSDTDSQIHHLQLQLQQLQKMQHQQQTLLQNPLNYKFSLDVPSGSMPSPSAIPPSQPLRVSPPASNTIPLTPNALGQPLTPTLQPLTPQPYLSPNVAGLTLPNGLPSPSLPPTLTLPTSGPVVFAPNSPQPSLEQLAAQYNVRLDSSSDGQIPLDSETRDFIAHALNVNVEVPEYKLSSSMSDLYANPTTNTASLPEFDPASLFVQQFPTEPVTDDSSDDDMMMTDGNDLGPMLSPTPVSHNESTTATPVDNMSGSSPLSSSGPHSDLRHLTTMNLPICDEEVETPGGTKRTAGGPQFVTIPRGPLSDADVDTIVDKMGSLTMCPIKAAEMQNAQRDLLKQKPANTQAVVSCQAKLTEMMWRLADKTGRSELTPEINVVLHKLMGILLPRVSLWDASAVPYANLVHKFKVTLQMASEMAQPVVLLNARRHVIYANDYFHNLTGNLFVDTRLYDFEVFHPDDALRYMGYALDKMADRTNETRMRFKVLSLSSKDGYVECVVTPNVLFEQLTTMPMFSMLTFTRVDDIDASTNTSK